MAAKNDVTGDDIQTGVVNDLYRQNFDRIFGVKEKGNGDHQERSEVEGLAEGVCSDGSVRSEVQ